MDILDLSQVQIHNSPADIASWPVTVAITAIEMTPQGGLTLLFNHPIPNTWKWPSNPASPSDNFAYTVWAAVKLADGWHAAGFVQMWLDRAMGDRSLPPILSGYMNWWGDARRLWIPMDGYVPKAGDQVAFFVSAGNARLRTDVTSVRERSTVVVVTLPAGDSGSFTFSDSAPAQPSAPPIMPSPLPPAPASGALVDTLSAVLAQLQQQTALVAGLRSQVDVLTQQVAALASRPAPASQGTIVFPNYQASLFGASVVLKPQK